MSFINETPEGWASTTIGEIVDLNPLKPSLRAFPDNLPVTFVPMPAVHAESGAITTPEERHFGEVRKGYTAFRENDVLFAKITPCMENGKAAIATNLLNGLGFGSTEFHVMRPTDAVIPEIIYYFVRQESFRRGAEAEMTGSVGQKRVPPSFVENAEICLPPLAEQKRIVAKVEELLSRVNAARERLEKVPKIMKRFRQSVLASACSGMLTEDWREKNPRVEGASVILKRIHGGKESQPWLAPSFEHRIESSLPDSWIFAALGNLGTWSGGGTPSKSVARFWTAGTIPWTTPKDMKSPVLSVSQDHITEEARKKTHLQLFEPGTILLVVRGLILARSFPVALVGKATTINQDIRALIPHKGLSSAYLLHALRAEEHEILHAVRDSTHGTKRLESYTLKQWPIPMPPVEEQKEIVRRVDALFTLADAIEKRVTLATARADKLAQSILAKAFRGELVPTEAELARREGRQYEPASALLERIKTERRKDTAGGRRAKRKK